MDGLFGAEGSLIVRFVVAFVMMLVVQKLILRIAPAPALHVPAQPIAAV